MTDTSSELACPKCGASMVRRQRRSDRAEFWGCPNYPKCHGTRPLEAIAATRPAPSTEEPGNATAWDDPSWQRAVAGASTRATFERRQAGHTQRVRERRPKILLTGAATVVVGLVLLTQGGTMPLAGLAIVFLGIVSTLTALFVAPAHVRAWQIGAVGEERVGRILEELEPEGFHALHDRRRPGARENIDHVVIGPPGVIIVETKHYSATVRVRGKDLYIGGRRKTAFVDQVERQIESVATALGTDRVSGVICVVGGDFPFFGARSIRGIQLVTERGLAKHLRSRTPVLTGADAAALSEAAERVLRPASQKVQRD